MQTFLGSVAEMERELTVVRISEVMAKAKRCGTRSGRPVGRPPRETPVSFKNYYHMLKDRNITATCFVRLIGFSRAKLYQYKID